MNSLAMPSATRLLKWGNHYHLGIEEIDRQHERLADLLNQLYTAHRGGEPRGHLGRLLTEFLNTVIDHFATEDDLMKRTRYGGAELHTAEHGFLANQLTEFHTNFEAGAVPLSESMMIYLKDWLRDHILVADRRLGDFLNSR